MTPKHGLAQLQSDVMHALLAPAVEAALPLVPRIAERGALTVARRIGIYHNAYRVRLMDALRDSHEHTAMYLGDDWFERAARGYIDAHPPCHASLRDFGDHFSDWLADAHAEDLDISEMARLDRALRRSFDGADSEALTLADLAGVAPEAWATLGFRLQPTATRLPVRMNTLAIWHALDTDEVPPPAAPLPEAAEILVWRRELSPHFRSLGAFESAALGRIEAGVSFADTCEQLGDLFPHLATAEEAGALLRRWVEEGLLRRP